MPAAEVGAAPETAPVELWLRLDDPQVPTWAVLRFDQFFNVFPDRLVRTTGGPVQSHSLQGIEAAAAWACMVAPFDYDAEARRMVVQRAVQSASVVPG